MALTLTQMRAVQWGNSRHWDLKFTSVPIDSLKGGGRSSSPIVPAFEVEIPEFSPIAQPFNITSMSVDIPLGSSPQPMSISFYDDSKETIFKYFKSWIDDFFDKGNGCRTLEELVREVMVNKLNPDLSIMETKTYYVIPSSTISFRGTSESNLKTYSLNFSIVGRR
jgi:hypothetical protein